MQPNPKWGLIYVVRKDHNFVIRGDKINEVVPADWDCTKEAKGVQSKPGISLIN
jgi:hypothetical protein